MNSTNEAWFQSNILFWISRSNYLGDQIKGFLSLLCLSFARNSFGWNSKSSVSSFQEEEDKQIMDFLFYVWGKKQAVKTAKQREWVHLKLCRPKTSPYSYNNQRLPLVSKWRTERSSLFRTSLYQTLANGHRRAPEEEEFVAWIQADPID